MAVGGTDLSSRIVRSEDEGPVHNRIEIQGHWRFAGSPHVGHDEQVADVCIEDLGIQSISGSDKKMKRETNLLEGHLGRVIG